MTLQLLQTTQKSHSEEKTFVIVPPQVYKYYELLKRKNITIVKDELYKTTYYIGDSFVHVINSSGNFNTTFYYADGVLVAEKDNAGNKKFYHPDHLGSTSLITNSSGQIVEETFYEPFGEVLSGGSVSRYDYNSKELDGTGLNYYGARYYKSSQSQFIQPDSNLPNIYNPQYLNRYAYVLNNPYKYVDPNGKWAVQVGFTANGAIGIGIIGLGGLAGGGFAVTYNEINKEVQVGKFETLGGGLGVGGGKVGVNIVSFNSNIRTLDELEGIQTSVGVSGNAIPGVPLTYGADYNSKDKSTLNFGIGEGIEGHVFTQYNKITPLYSSKTGVTYKPSLNSIIGINEFNLFTKEDFQQSTQNNKPSVNNDGHSKEDYKWGSGGWNSKGGKENK